MCLYRSCSWINENAQKLYLSLPFYESLPFCVWHRHCLWQHLLIRNLIGKPYFDSDAFGMPLIINEWQAEHPDLPNYRKIRKKMRSETDYRKLAAADLEGILNHEALQISENSVLYPNNFLTKLCFPESTLFLSATVHQQLSISNNPTKRSLSISGD
ncbi:hypothetical protein KSP40_PGU020319 [Platanthera guangdongensis]|uniref:Uncharacterized protein n=1 Tax=Platanthera guangdongensis TaxID=2320717 RepID=A0ABR2MRY6_9ASPA